MLSEVTTCVRVLVAPIPRSRSSEPKRVLVLVVQNRNEVGRNMLTHVVLRQLLSEVTTCVRVLELSVLSDFCCD